MNQAFTLTSINSTRALDDDELKQVTRAANILRSVGVECWLALPDGTAGGNPARVLELTATKYTVALRDGAELDNTPPRVRRAPRQRHLDYFLPYLEAVQVWQRAQIPVGDRDAHSLAGSVSAWCGTHWGKGCYSTYLSICKTVVTATRELSKEG